MRSTVRVLCRPEVAPGFALAGLVTVEATGAEETVRRLADLGADETLGIVLVEASLYDALPEEVRKAIVRRPLPMIVPFPGPQPRAGSAAEEYVVEILRQAIGYSVRLR